MKRAHLLVGALVLALFAVMQYALLQVRSEEKENLLSIVQNEKTQQVPVGFSTDSIVFTSSTLGVEIRVPGIASSSYRWKILEKTESSSTSIFVAEVIKKASGSEPECRTRMWVAPQSVTKYAGQEASTYQIAGNERAHVEASNASLCGLELTFDLGNGFQAKHIALKQQADFSDFECHDYSLTWSAASGKMVERSIVRNFYDDKNVISEGGCTPYSLKVVQVPGSTNTYLLIAIHPTMGSDTFYAGEHPLGLIQKDAGTTSLGLFATPYRYRSVSPSGRYLFYAQPVEFNGVEQEVLDVYDLASERSMRNAHKVLPSGRRLGEAEAALGEMAPPPRMEWIAADDRTIVIRTTDKNGKNPKRLIFSF